MREGRRSEGEREGGGHRDGQRGNGGGIFGGTERKRTRQEKKKFERETRDYFGSGRRRPINDVRVDLLAVGFF